MQETTARRAGPRTEAPDINAARDPHIAGTDSAGRFSTAGRRDSPAAEQLQANGAAGRGGGTVWCVQFSFL